MIICELCKKEFKTITHTHLSKEHNLTTKEYSNMFPNAKLTWCKGLTKETDERLLKQGESESRTKQSEEWIETIGKESARKMSESRLRGIREGKIKTWNKDKEQYQTRGKNNPACKPGVGEKISKKLKGRKITWGDKISKTKKENQDSNKLWQNPEYREKTTKAILKGMFKRPTSLEKQAIEIIEKNNLPYKYCGDGSVLIGWKNPDFVNVNGEKICIEVANTYHHDENYPQKRSEYFSKWGWKCLVFRCDEINEKEFVEKVNLAR